MNDYEFERKNLEKAIRETGADMSALSKKIGKNQTYIQQYITKGVPKRLSYEIRQTLAKELNRPAMFGNDKPLVEYDDDFMEIMAQVNTPEIKAKVKDLVLRELLSKK